MPLFEQAYRWRDRQRSDRMPFEQFAADSPQQIVLGLFNGELQAAYLLSEVDGVWECHFTSRRDADKHMVLAGARWVIDYFKANGLRLCAYVRPRNQPLCRFAEAVGLEPDALVTLENGVFQRFRA